MLADKTRLTQADYRAFIDQPENADRGFEPIDGEIVEKMPGFELSQIAIEIAYQLKHFLRQYPLG